MDEESNKKARWRSKIIPVIVRSLLLALVLVLIGAMMQVYAAVTRPDLRFRLIPYGGELPQHMFFKKGVVVSGVRYGTVFRRILKYDDVDEHYNLETGIFTMGVDCWISGDDIESFMRTVEFDFPGRPQQTMFRISAQEIPHEKLVPLTACATYQDVIRIMVCVVDYKLETQYISRIEIPFPREALGANVRIGNTIMASELISDSGRQEHIAVSIGFDQYPFAHIEWHDQADEGELDPGMRQTLGVVIAPAQQDDWSAPFKIIPMPSAPMLIYAGPYGWPCIIAYSGGSSNGWYIRPMNGEEENTDQSIFMVNSDSWQSVYLLSTNNGFIHDRYRAGELDVEEISPDIWPYAIDFAYSVHTENTAATELSVLSWPGGNDYQGILYNTYTISDTSLQDERRWWFEPEESYEIDYGPVILKSTPFENSEQRLGFALINVDGSAGFLIQPDFFSPQELSWIMQPPDTDTPGTRYQSFLGVIPLDEHTDAYAFTTDSSELVILSEEGETLHHRKISDHFIDDDVKYSTDTVLIEQLNAVDPVLVVLDASESTKYCKLVINKKWQPAWCRILPAAWWTFGIIWLIGLGMEFRKIREDKFVAHEDHTAAILVEQEIKEKELDEAHEQRTLQARARLGQIADSLAHDLNSLLDAIRKNIELIRDSLSIDVAGEVSDILVDSSLASAFMDVLINGAKDPVYMTSSEVNSATDRLEEFLESRYPDLADSADLFAQNGFDEESIVDFINRFGEEKSGRLILILNREVSLRRAIGSSLDQVMLSLGIANRLKNITSRKAFDIRMGIETALQILHGDLAARKIVINEKYEDVPGLYGDPVPLVETISIIIQNAIDVLPEGGEIRIGISSRDDFLIVTIGNNGPRIPNESIDKIWGRGFTEGKSGGQGLGLYIARDLMEGIGGSISVTSDPDWTEFTLNLPLTSRIDGSSAI